MGFSVSLCGALGGFALFSRERRSSKNRVQKTAKRIKDPRFYGAISGPLLSFFARERGWNLYTISYFLEEITQMNDDS